MNTGDDSSSSAHVRALEQVVFFDCRVVSCFVKSRDELPDRTSTPSVQFLTSVRNTNARSPTQLSRVFDSHVANACLIVRTIGRNVSVQNLGGAIGKRNLLERRRTLTC